MTESASNGNANLDDPRLGGVFTTARPHSGAIMIGGAIPSKEHQVATGLGMPAERSRAPWSSYGSRMDVQAWGEQIYAAGYGWLNNTEGTTPQNSWYNNNFGGTSGASAITAGLAASLSGAIEAKYGRPATPAEVLDALKFGATPQDLTSPDAPAGRIGPQPDMRMAFSRITGVLPPAAPTNASAVLSPQGKPRLLWDVPPNGTSAVSGYEIYREGVMVALLLSGQNPPFMPGRMQYVDQTADYDSYFNYHIKTLYVNGSRSNAALLAVSTPLFADGFEALNLNAWTVKTNMTTLAANNRIWARAFSATTAKRPAFAYKDFGFVVPNLYLKSDVKVVTSGAAPVNLLVAKTGTGKPIATLARNQSGKLILVNNITGATTTSAFQVNLNTVYNMQLRTKISGATSQNEVWVNGTKIAALTKTHNLGTVSSRIVQIGDANSTRAFDVHFSGVVADRKFVK